VEGGSRDRRIKWRLMTANVGEMKTSHRCSWQRLAPDVSYTRAVFLNFFLKFGSSAFV